MIGRWLYLGAYQWGKVLGRMLYLGAFQWGKALSAWQDFYILELDLWDKHYLPGKREEKNELLVINRVVTGIGCCEHFSSCGILILRS